MLGLLRRRVLAFSREGYEGNVAGTLDRCAELALVPGTVPGDAARDDLATLSNEIS